MDIVQRLIEEIEQAREVFLASIRTLSPEFSIFKPEPEIWSVLEITEHIARAEQSGVMGMWKALDGFRKNEPVWIGEMIHQGLSIEEVVKKTWQAKEKVPEIAAPRWGGSLDYWIATLRSQKYVLLDLGQALTGINLEEVIYPHPISVPLNLRQRLEFLRFHLDRHRDQIERLKLEMNPTQN